MRFNYNADLRRAMPRPLLTADRRKPNIRTIRSATSFTFRLAARPT